MNIPFNKIHLTGHEVEYITKALEMGSVVGDGFFDKKVTRLLENRLKSIKILTTTSGTHALELAMMLINIKSGDEVIMPSYTFSSTANAVMLQGGIPVFVDIDENTLTMNLEEMEKKITENTKALLPVHYGGIGCPMDKIMHLAEKYNLYVIEDAAQVLGATYRGKPLGTWGHIGCYSFHGTKNYISGEGGALSINIKDPALLKRADFLRQKGTNRNQFIRGEVSRYTWIDVGSSYVPSDILMAMLYAQLQNIDEIIKKRKIIVEFYTHHLQQYIDKGIFLSMTNVPLDFQSNYHNFYILLKDKKTRDDVMSRLKENHIQSTIHFVPLHHSPMGLSLGYQTLDLPTTKKVGDTLLRLPLYTDMEKKELDYVVEKLHEILGEIS
ncbi:dTDP-4-amino-4,6-dideoxygalactose transaminase [Irregularibacter muris]|uniref:dTDP-4-amino-4,6-dideoxygalactose transaminase n=1 Tax=Irregularibacter muris TaxID=1796619 RepID=A0AAE3HGC8_9FIRM|nr:dTDP-4-amino-4,6-dideoxygalactose transaminase [Irregularibacter muris]MCR1898940.1 dTDP-4-amino-4,6-dideoxygalactose transaminase [Irregularibacter muris]